MYHGILSIEWTSDLTNSPQMNYLETDKLIHMITQ